MLSSREELEERVQQRTAALATANMELTAEIQERKQMEAALRASEESYRDLFDNAQDAIYVHDLKGTYISANRAAEKLSGYTIDEIVGKNIIEFMAPEYADRIRTNLGKKLKGGGLTTYEIEMLAKDGRRVPVEVNTRLIYESGTAVAVQGMARDITERKRAEAERQIISEIVQGVITTANLDELLQLTHSSIRKLLYAENCFVNLYDPATCLMHFEFWADKFDPVPEPRPVGTSFSSYVLRTSQPILLTEATKQRMYEQGEVELSGTDSASWLGVPLRTPSGTIGVLAVQHYEEPTAYTQRDLEFLSAVGDGRNHFPVAVAGRIYRDLNGRFGGNATEQVANTVKPQMRTDDLGARISLSAAEKNSTDSDEEADQAADDSTANATPLKMETPITLWGTQRTPPDRRVRRVIMPIPSRSTAPAKPAGNKSTSRTKSTDSGKYAPRH